MSRWEYYYKMTASYVREGLAWLALLCTCGLMVALVLGWTL